MKRIRINWRKLDKMSTIIWPIIISAAIIVTAFLLTGFYSPIAWAWTTGTFCVLFVIYGVALFLEPVSIINNKNIFRLIWAILGIGAGYSSVIFSDLTINLLSEIIIIPSLVIFYIIGLIRIRKGS